jgi:formate-dependent nitrite reductase cytochrome c552 subunit
VKTCSKCKQNPRLSYNRYCRDCHNQRQKEYYKKNPRSTNESHQRRKALIRDMVIEAKRKPCADCHKEYPYYVMDFDHVRGEKKFNLSVAAVKMRSLETVRKEIEKCDILCANCHRERTFNRTMVVVR